MVRVGGGWTTLSHFLARHGGDPNQQILPDELLPLDTKSSQMNGPNGGMNYQSRTTSANRHHHSHRIHNTNNGSTTHTLVISTTTKTTPISNSNNVVSARKSSITSDFLKSTNYGQQKFNSTNSRNVGMMSIHSTPVSRRNSVSSSYVADSPEPSYNSSLATSPILTNIAPLSSQTKIPILRQNLRSRLPMMICDAGSQSSKQLLRSTSSIISISPSSQELSTYIKQQQLRQQTLNNGKTQYTQRSMIPRSTTEFGQMRRYANYLRSSQHITNKESLANSNTSLNSQQSQTPIRTNHRPNTGFSQKTC